MARTRAGTTPAHRPLAERVALAQGTFYVASGVWPIFHMPSFEAVTGPKTDRWLVRTVGALVTVIGGVLVASARRGRVSPEISLLGVASGGVLAAVDVYYVMRRRISPVYLADAAAEAGLAAMWVRAGGREHTRRS